MDKTAEPPDPEIGQVHEVEQGELKIELLIDMSVSADLLVNKDYKCFCRCGKHLNNDHTQTAIRYSATQK